ncbi:MAG: phosphate ABC transporter substrate-binding protein PstS [Bdellovibrionales bacterium RIFOXYB1_FULL_37_110]|nr:MAG: phosphate ABC transporter substrate-binding protein PstS [Bdellovibrionales bacterium RIFOXYC1_FULL_37_79]OFZ55597.1 MAG: phosphate ABC transporter substrate-binding protein PstS [Bdellovibrionales bacterium RIFOXYB2_FULL_36_6]OFZ59172.1 MAG: phosphate ABC transporter substrate-binding protein PstS [Bdellovibrionales bacterium RIFOXYB1_FULL_37_110]OFZ64177.1 MAG: phosphate ABC transporter substrate-binding protein PstS [Bdellovibrionales bacterium RIFOXYD1_FULL_36_51]
MILVLGLWVMSLSLGAVTKINGAGATFPYPIYSKWFSEYHKLKGDIQFNYQSIGSGGGIQQLLQQTVDFGASDAPMSDEDLKKASWPVLHIPTVIGSVAIVYNLDGVPNNLKISSKVLTDIFIGKIVKWNDEALKKLNPQINLPDKDILVVTRADGSGTTAIFTDYLSKISSEWKNKVGNGKTVSWPAGIGGKGNEGVTAVVQKTQGSIGYVELAYALTNKLNIFSLENLDKVFVTPSVEGTSLAAASLSDKEYLGDLRLSLVNASGKQAYPISAFTYILLPVKQNNAENKEVRNFLLWALTKGQQFAPELHYAALPKKLSDSLIKKIKALKD